MLLVLRVSHVGLITLFVLTASPALAGGGQRNPERAKQMHQRTEGALRVGDPAPDAAVVDRAGKPLQLATLLSKERPTVLVFGSFT